MTRQPSEQRVAWDMRYIIRSGNTWENYEKELEKEFSKRDWGLMSNNTERWENFCADLIAISKSVYPLAYVKWTEAQRLAKKNYLKELNVFNRLRAVDQQRTPDDLDPALDLPPMIPPGAYCNLIAARATMKNLDREKKLLDLTKHVEIMEKLTNVGERVASTYKYLQAYKKVHSVKASSQVTLRDWERVLLKFSGESVPKIIEDDYFPMLPLRWFGGLRDVLERVKFGKAPGLDLLSVEMLRGNIVATELFYKLIQNVFLTNDVPKQWTMTITQPIPKKSNPRSTDEYRCITLCSLGYKCYTIMLQQILIPFLPKFRDYQHGFLPNRSCDDEVFILKRILEERWNFGLPTYLLVLDFAKAFDTVNIHLLPEILRKHGVPHFLINRLVEACLQETSCIRWEGKKTVTVNKSVGVKQGCPIAPLLFNLVLDAALSQLQQTMLMKYNVNLFLGEPEQPIHFPMVLAYADDTTLLVQSLGEARQLLSEFIPAMAPYGLTININKSGVLLKDPTRQILIPPNLKVNFQDFCTMQVKEIELPFIKTCKILGVGVNDNMHRRASIRGRCLSTVRLLKSIMPMLKSLRAPLEVLIRLYHSIISPSMLYGVKCGSMSITNERSLMNREIQMIRDLISIATQKPRNASFYKLLTGKTINRKVSVLRLRYFGHVSRRPLESLLKKARDLTYTMPRRVGRPLYTFAHSLKRDQSKFPEYIGDDWHPLYNDKLKLHSITKQLYKIRPLEPNDPLDENLLIYPNLPL